MQDFEPPIPPETPTVEAPLARHRGWHALAVMVDWLKTVSFALVLFVIVRTVLVEPYKIPSGSMEGTLLVGDFLLVNKLVYGAEIPLTHTRLPAIRSPQRGDVVVFKYPIDPTANFVKRVVGLAGDTVEMRDGALMRNGVTLHERYVRHTQPGSDPGDEEFRWQRDFLVQSVVPSARASARGYHPSRNNWGPLLVPAHHYFVLGDNRDNSLDSRYWGFLPDSLVRGQPLFVYYSYASESDPALDWITHIRWQRLFTKIK